MKKLNTKAGFTLAELLIVVAIIAVLVAIAIPVFTSRLEASREATDIANQRAAKAAALVSYMDATSPDAAGVSYYFNAATGLVAAANTGIVGYGKGTTVVGNSNNTQDGYNPSADCVGKIVKVTIVPGGSGAEPTITVAWEAAA